MQKACAQFLLPADAREGLLSGKRARQAVTANRPRLSYIGSPQPIRLSSMEVTATKVMEGPQPQLALHCHRETAPKISRRKCRVRQRGSGAAGQFRHCGMGGSRTALLLFEAKEPFRLFPRGQAVAFARAWHLGGYGYPLPARRRTARVG